MLGGCCFFSTMRITFLELLPQNVVISFFLLSLPLSLPLSLSLSLFRAFTEITVIRRHGGAERRRDSSPEDARWICRT